MTTNGALSATIISALKSSNIFDEFTIVEAYQSQIKPTPISNPIIAVSVKGCTLGEQITEILDTGLSNKTIKRNLNTTLSIDVYLPYTMGGSIGHQIFDKIATYLIYTKSMDILKAVSNELEHDKSCEALILRNDFVFHSVISA